MYGEDEKVAVETFADAFVTTYPATMSRRYDADFDAIFGGGDRGDIAFFAGLGAAARGPVCEVGAGTGRVLIPVAAATTHVVTGVEPSEAMRSQFEQHVASVGAEVRGRLGMVAGSFEQIPLADQSQDLVYGAFRSFQHVLTPAAQLASLAEMRRVLRPGGTLAFDLFDPDYAALATQEPRCVAVYPTAAGRVVERWDAYRLDRPRQLAHLHFRWIERDSDGHVVHTEDDGYTVRYTFPQELLHLMALGGWRDVQLFGGYDGRPLGAEPDELVIVARR